MPVVYLKSFEVVPGITDVNAQYFNSLMAEVKMAVEGCPSHDVDITVAYAGGSSGDLPSTITITDNSATTEYDITCVCTISYNADDTPSQAVWVFSNLGITVTEVFTYTSGVPTAIGRTLS